VGSNAPVQVDVRVVAATNRNLKAAVAARRFRDDLYFRLSVFPITMPPLRERRTDIPILASFFIDRVAHEQKRRPPMLSPAALDALEHYEWPGNVRELQNCLERAVILADGDTVHPAHLQLPVVEPALGQAGPAESAEDPWDRIDLSGTLGEVSRRVLTEVERRVIARALDQTAGDLPRAAEILQIPLRMLTGKVRDHRLR
jgi:DNA-binding NtrC family response regulator